MLELIQYIRVLYVLILFALIIIRNIISNIMDKLCIIYYLYIHIIYNIHVNLLRVLNIIVTYK